MTMQQPLPSAEAEPRAPGDGASALSSRNGLVLLLVILALGAGLRFFDLGLARHSYDDAYPSYDALRMLDSHEFRLTGQSSSVFLDNPALMSYIQALPLLVWRSPWGIYILMVALNCAAIWFVYRVGTETLGRDVGLLAALMFAVNPWMVYYNRATWLPALVPCLLAVLAWVLWPCLADGRSTSKRVLVGSLALTVLTQTYVQAWGALTQVAPLLLAFRPRLPRRALLIGLAIPILAAALYGLGLARQWTTGRPEFKFFSQGQWRLTREGWDHALRLVTGDNFEYVYPGPEAGDYALRHRLSSWARVALTLALLAGLGRCVLALRNPPEGSRTLREADATRRIAVTLLVWFLVPVALMSVSAHPVHIYYLLLTCPAGHVLAAWGAALLLRHPLLRRPLAVVLVSVVLLFGLNLHRANQQVAAQPTAPRFEDWALEAGARLGAAIRSHVTSFGPNPRVVADAREPVLSSLGATRLHILPNVLAPNYVVLPGAQPLLYVLAGSTAQPADLGPLQALGQAQVLRFADDTVVTLLQVPPQSREAASRLPQVTLDWPSETGLTLLGYALEPNAQAGSEMGCTTYWRVDELLPARAVWYIGAFYHLMSASDAMRANVSGRGQWGHAWELGDVYIERVRIPLPADLAAGEYRLDVGLFDTIHGINYRLRSPNGLVDAASAAVTVTEGRVTATAD